MVTAIIIAAMIQLGIINDSSEYTNSLYLENQNAVEIVIDDIKGN